MAGDFKATAEAYQKFAQALEQLESARKLFESAGEPLPEKLKEFFGLNRNGRQSSPSVSIMPPHRKATPSEAKNDWLSIRVSEAMATTLVLAVLRRSDKPIPAKQVVELVAQLDPYTTKGVIHNIGTRLDGKSINRSEEGWTLIDPAKAGVLTDGYIWGPKEIFEKQELAAHRREAILLLLKAFPGGLQTVQILDVLRGTSWVHAPATKDLIKGDMELLEANNKVRRISNSRKWGLVQSD